MFAGKNRLDRALLAYWGESRHGLSATLAQNLGPPAPSSLVAHHDQCPWVRHEKPALARWRGGAIRILL